MSKPLPTKKLIAELSDKLFSLLQRENSKSAMRAAERLRIKVRQRPMAAILAKLPGTPSERAKLLGVSRQSYYSWLSGRQRPNDVQAEKIERITGIPKREIRGK